LFCSITKKPTRSVALRIARGAGLESKGKAMDEDQERYQRARRLITQAIRGYDQQKALCVHLIRTIHNSDEAEEKIENFINHITDRIGEFQENESYVSYFIGSFAMLGLLDSLMAYADSVFSNNESEGYHD
jgi:isocitrate dehydrogenase kinase/phosphatase